MGNTQNLFQVFLEKHDANAWEETLRELLPSIHEVDSVATRIWFSFFPLKLARALSSDPDPTKLSKELLLNGKFKLEEQIDNSAEFLYGHRYWPQVKKAVVNSLGRPPKNPKLSQHIVDVASSVAKELQVDRSLLVGIMAVAFMTLQQAGQQAFERVAASNIPPSKWARSAEQVLSDRHNEDDRGFLSFLRPNKEYTVTFRENDPAGNFRLIRLQDLAMAAAHDKRDYRSRDPRCIEGPIPVECRSAACGTCWVGILAGGKKLAPPADLEIRRMKEFGYSGFTGDENSVIRLACQATSYGNVSIVIPPWNGIIGKLNNPS